MKLGRLILPPIVLAAVAGFIAFHSAQQARPAEASGAALSLPTASCAVGSSSASVDFSWMPYVGETQWLDVGTTENFAPGTFTGYGPMTIEATSQKVEALPRNTVHFWRINTFGPGGWTSSETGAFVPCGAPKLLWGPTICETRFRARVTIRWAPSANPAGIAKQYIDVGYDPSFARDTFVARDHGPATLSYTWSGLAANVQTFFRVNALGNDGVWHTSDLGSFTAECAPPLRLGIIHSGDRLIVPRIGINAPVNVRDVGHAGTMGDPEGPLDVVRYTFPLVDGFGGYPGQGGTTLIAGHLDFRNYGLAVFGHLEQLAEGDVIDYLREDGTLVSYQVSWVSDVHPDFNYGELARNTSTESLVLITCNGEFNWTIEEYPLRRLVYATKLPPAAQ
jgi:LPXTG-site transpeptidase (sortase) family protein